MTSKLTKQYVHFRGWETGCNKDEFTKLMKAEVGVELAAAKNLIDRFEAITIWVEDAESTTQSARRAGAVAVDRLGKTHGD